MPSLSKSIAGSYARKQLGHKTVSSADGTGDEVHGVERLQGRLRFRSGIERQRVLGVVSRRDFLGAEKARLEDEIAVWEVIG